MYVCTYVSIYVRMYVYVYVYDQSLEADAIFDVRRREGPSGSSLRFLCWGAGSLHWLEISFNAARLHVRRTNWLDERVGPTWCIQGCMYVSVYDP